MRTTVKWKVAQGLEIRWWKRYLRNKDTEEYLSWKKEYWYGFLKPLHPFLKMTPETRILDAGCGPAGIFIALETGAVTALDPLLDHYEAELPHFSKANYPSVTFVNLPLEKFNAIRKFDLIFCLNALNHVSDIEAAVKVLFDSADSGATLVLSIDCHRHRMFKRLFRWIPGDALHPHQLDLEDYKALMKRYGGAILHTEKTRSGGIFDYYTLVIQNN